MPDDDTFPQPVSNDDHLPTFGEADDSAVPHDAPNTDEAVTNTDEILGDKEPEAEEESS